MPVEMLKDPEARLDYTFDWRAETNGTGDSDWLLDGDSISTHTLTVPSGLTLDTESADGDTVTAWLEGGTAGQSYTVTCHITTVQGRQDDRSLLITVTNR